MKQVENKQGFLILALSLEETKLLRFGFQEGCVCMHCNKIIEEPIYYIAVLNDCMCKDCFNNWISTAKRYKEDKHIEERNYNYVLHLLEQAAESIEPTYPQIYYDDMDFIISDILKLFR